MADNDTPVSPSRRTHRVQISMPVVVRSKNFQEVTNTVTVNAHGCLVLLKAKVVREEQVQLLNPKTAEELPAKVVFLGKSEDGKLSVGLQFLEASPLFWRISFPPDDWFTSTERKRPGSTGNRPASTASHPVSSPQRGIK